MKAENFLLQDYLLRIGFTGKVEPDIRSVNALMKHQLLSVPFENLDVQAGKIVSLVPEEIVEKIVHRKRGGYCYEVNGLFAMVLETLGIPYQFIAARPMFYPVRRPKTHMAIIVTLDGIQWLCDLGFGSYGIREPLRLDHSNTEVVQDVDLFRLLHTDEGNYLLQAHAGGTWANQYEFNLSPQEWIDFVPANYLNSTHPEAVFVQKLLITMHTRNGRKSLIGNVFREVSGGVVHETSVEQSALPSLLSDAFGLQLP